MKALLLLLALVALAACQPDFGGRRTVRGQLSPSSSGTVFDNAEADTEESYVVGCDVNVHALTGVNSNTNTQASTITLVLDNTVPDADDQALFVVLIGPDGRNVFPTTDRTPLPSGGDATSFIGGGFTCQSNEFCVVDYHCAPFDGGSYSIEISQADPPSAVNNYTITAYEWSETADSISVTSDRFSFDENSAESRVHVTGTELEVDSIPGPRTFRHYYVDFNRDLPRLGAHTLLKIRVVDWFDDNNLNITSGNVALCYNTNYFVGATDTTSSLSANDEDPCDDVCEEFVLDVDDVVEIEFSSGCAIPADELWLGIRTPQDGTPARYTIEFITKAKTIYPVTTITEPSVKLDNYLDEWDSDFCAPSEGGFTCEAYYETSLASVGLGANSFSNGHGPWFIAHIHGVSNGDLYFNVHDSDFGGPKSRCSEPRWYCGGDGGEINGSGDNDGAPIPGDNPIQEGEECYVWIPPCYWTDDGTVDGELDITARNWVTTVVGLNVDGDEDRLFYGIDFDVLAMPLTAVQLSERMGPIFGQIRTGFYNHYSVAIPQDAIVPSSKFVVEMYSRHEDHDLALFWNYNTEAGFEEDCLSYRGRCDTLGDEQRDDSDGYNDDHNYCRFAFLVCDNPSESFTLSNPRQVNDSLWWTGSDYSRNDIYGLRVDNLLAGTYYFSVHALRNPDDYDSYDYESKFTLQMSFTDGEELWEGEPVLDHVYLNEYSTHYYFDMPSAEDDPLVQGIEIYVADVQNFRTEGTVSAHWNCDALAGNCPCFTNEASADFDPEGNHHEIFYIPRCSCPGRVWVSVENRARYGAFNLTGGALKPVGFTVTARVVRSVQEDAASGSLFDPENGFVNEFQVPRDQWGKASAVIAPRFDEAACRSCLNYRFYRFVFNTLQPGDALVTRLEFVPEIEDATPEAWLFVISNVDRTLAVDPGCSTRNVLDGRIQACRARANLDEGWNGLPGEEWSFCQLVFEPCTADASNDACYDDQNEFDNSAIQARRFDQDREWYAAVQSVDDLSAIVYTLQAQVRSQVATSLVDGVAIQDLVFEGTYNHYSFSVTGSASAQSLVFEFYSIVDQNAEIRFYINAGTFAGLEQDCLSSIHQSTLGLCSECVLFANGVDDEDAVSCSYQVRPCDLEDTTYYVSAYQWWDPTEAHTHAFFDDRFYYTISAHIQEPIELLATGHPFTGQLWEWDDDDATVHSTAYYTVTVPGNLQPSRLRLTISAVEADSIFVTVGGRSPVDFCRCPRTGLELFGGTGASLEWTRDFCDLTPNDVYWVVVDGITYNSAPATFTIHAEQIPYRLVEVDLITRSDNNDPVFLSPVVSYYDSERGAINTPTISPQVVSNAWERYDSYFWDVTAAVGRSMNIRFRQNHPNDTQTIDYYLSTGSPVSTASANGGFGDVVGPLPDDLCDNLYQFGSGTFTTEGTAQRIHINPCELQSTTYFLTFSGESLEVNSEVPFIDLKIVLVDALNIIEVPTSSDPVAVTGDENEFDGLFESVDYDNELENNLENGLYFRTTSSISLDAGERLVFTKNGGGGSMEVSFENLPCDGVLCDDNECEFFACEDMSGEWWIRLTDVSTSITDITLELIPSDTVDSGLSVTSVSSIELGDNPPVFDALPANEWQWFRISSDADFDNDLVRRFSTNISVANFFYTATTPVFAPALRDEGDNDWIAIYSETAALGFGATSPPTCGGVSYDPEPDVNGVCCVGDLDILFAVANGADEDFNIEFIEQALNSGAPSSPGSSITSTQSVGIGEIDEPGARRTVRWFQFTVEEGSQGFWYFFNTTDANADGDNFELYANIGSLAGSDNDANCPGFNDDMVDSDQDPAICHQEIGTGSLDVQCTNSFGDDACVGFIPICDGCNYEGARVYLAVTSQYEAEAEFNLAIEQVSDIGSLSVSVGSSDSVSVGEFPNDSQLRWEELSFNSNGDDAFLSCNAVYDQYTVDVSALVSDLMDDPSFFPDFDDLDDSDRFQFVLRLTNIEEVGGADGDLPEGRVTDEVRWYISSSAGLAGDCGCYNDVEWDDGSSPCDETNVIELETDTTWEYECIIYAENLVSGCAANGGATWSVAIGRGDDNGGELPQFSYTLTADFFVNSTSTNEYNINSVSTSSSIAAGSVPNSFTSIDSTNDFGDGNAENVDTWLKVDVSGLGPTDYLRVWFQFTEDGLNLDTSLMEPNTLGDFSPITVEPFVGGYYTDAEPVDLLWRDDVASTNNYNDEARNDCGTIDLDDNGEYICSVQFAPRDLSIFYGPNGRNELWLRVEINSEPDRDYSFGVYAERKTIDVVQEDLLPVDGFVKINDTLFDIFDRQWRFHQFTIAENNGLYNDLYIEVYDEECGDVGLEVYSTFSGNTDVMRPSRVPTPAQHVADGSSFSIDPNCQIHGGNYWIGVWAPEDFQTFPDPIDVPGNNPDFEVRPGTYRVYAELSEWPQKTLDPECWYTETAENFIPRIVIPVEAENRGSELVVEFSYRTNDGLLSDGDWGLFVSHGNHPHGPDTCSWDTVVSDTPYTDTAYDYGCESGGSSCWVVIPACEFEQGNYYVWIAGLNNFADDDRLTVRSYFDRKHIPVATLNELNGYTATWTGQLIEHAYTYGSYQYYKVVVDSDANREGHFDVRLTIEDCDGSDCDLDMYVTRGPVGHANDFDAFQEFSSGNCHIDDGDATGEWDSSDVCNCHDYYWGSTERLHGDLIIDSLCYAEDNQYFIGVRQTDTDLCVFSVTVSVRESVETIVPNEIVCSEVNCVDYYRVDLSGVPDQRLITSISADLVATDGDDLRLLFKEGRIPYWVGLDSFTPDFDDGNSETSGCFDDSDFGSSPSITWIPNCGDVGTYYLAVQNPSADLYNCEDCDSAVPYQLELTITTLDFTNGTFINVPAAATLIDSPYDLYDGRAGCPATCGVYTDTVILANGITDENLDELTVETIGSAPGILNDGQPLRITDWFGEPLRRFYTPLPDSTTFNIYVDNVESACGFTAEDMEYAVGVNGEFDSVPCSCSGDGTFSATCTGGVSQPYTCFEGNVNHVVTIDTCVDPLCPVSFDLWIEASGTDRVQLGTRHDEASGWVDVVRDRDCGGSETAYYVDVELGQPLSVQIREPFGGDDVTVTLDLSRQDCSYSTSCDVTDSTTQGVESDCRVDSQDNGVYSMYGCAPAGRYYVDVSAANLDSDYNYWSVQLSAWNRWVPLGTSGSATNLMFGADRHFYSFTNNGAAKISLEVHNGPSISFRVTDNFCEDNHFNHHQTCSFGRCVVSISTEALNSNAPTFYIVLTSDDVVSGRHANALATKTTNYDIEVKTGTAACAPRPSSGFCGGSATDVDAAFTSAAWNGPSAGSSTWDYENPTVRDNMARWKYASFVDGLCPSPPDECKRWLRRIACADAFPDCDASGFLLGTCRAACYEVECECGKWLADDPRPEFACLSGRYQEDQTGTCFTIPDRTPPPPPPPVNVTINFEDTCDVHVATLDAGLIDLQRATACSATDVEALLLIEAGGLARSGQIRTNEILGNEISVTIFGSNVESAVSICTRVVNRVTIERDGSLDGTCLQDAVLQIEENTDLLELDDTTPYVAPTSVVDPPPVLTIPGFTIPDNTIPTIPSQITIPDLLSTSGGYAVLPAALTLVLAVIVALFA